MTLSVVLIFFRWKWVFCRFPYWGPKIATGGPLFTVDSRQSIFAGDYTSFLLGLTSLTSPTLFVQQSSCNLRANFVQTVRNNCQRTVRQAANQFLPSGNIYTFARVKSTRKEDATAHKRMMTEIALEALFPSTHLCSRPIFWNSAVRACCENGGQT